MNTAKFVKEITVQDPDTGGDVELSIYKHECGGMFAVDSSFIDQCLEEHDEDRIPDVFHQNRLVKLVE